MTLATRRAFLHALPLAAAATGLTARAAPAAFELAPLPYAPEALDAAIDAETMSIHHGKHHAAYVRNLNTALAEQPSLASHGLDALVRELHKVPEQIRTTVRNNGGGHWNHDFFWKIMAPAGTGGEPAKPLAEAITRAFGGLEAMQKAVNDKALGAFGSGWGWLIVRPGGDLAAVSTPNQDNPLMKGVVPEASLGTPLLGVDVWEHAYYLRYQNRRADYLAAWWKVVNWTEVSRRFAAAHT
jgi:Fe-Mn family superoxide dismutase